MGRRFGSSLKVRIAAVASLLFLVGVCLIAGFSTRILHDDMQELLSQEQLTVTNYIARDIDAKVQLRLDSLTRVAQNLHPALFSSREAMQIWLDDRRAIHTLFPTGLMVIPPDGGPPLGESPKLETRPRSFVDRDWFIGATQTGRPYISKPLITRATGQPALVIAIPLYSDEKQLLGVIAGITPLSTPGFLDLMIGTRPGKLGSYQLIAPQHDLLALSSDLANAVKPLPAPGEDPIIDIARQQKFGVRTLRSAEAIDELVSVAAVPVAGWVLIGRQPAAEAFATVDNTLRNILLIMIVVALPIIILLLAALNYLLRPLARVAGELHAMAEGKRPMHPLDAQAADEVADVADSFNRLQEKLLEQEKRLTAMARHDTLTGLANRRVIEERLEAELQRMQRNDRGLALLFLDIDGFKPINDHYGHRVGDLVLIEIGQRLSTLVRDIDAVARLGGDEFLVLLTETDNPVEAAKRVAQECIERLALPFLADGHQVQIGVSIGIAIAASSNGPLHNAWQLVNRADAAMYRAKAAGRNRFTIDTPDTAASTQQA